jgi:hypothetical protein
MKKKKSKSRIRKKRVDELDCGHCNIFWHIPSQNRSGVNRYCCYINSDVNIHTESCNDFDLANNFWCKHFSFWTKPVICISRFKNNTCTKCSDGKKLYLYLEPIQIDIRWKGEDHEK